VGTWQNPPEVMKNTIKTIVIFPGMYFIGSNSL
jgi:hypothetical protein